MYCDLQSISREQEGLKGSYSQLYYHCYASECSRSKFVPSERPNRPNTRDAKQFAAKWAFLTSASFNANYIHER
jgi:hypothetical protein